MCNDGAEFRHPPMSHSVRHRIRLALDSGLQLATLTGKSERNSVIILTIDNKKEEKTNKLWLTFDSGLCMLGMLLYLKCYIYFMYSRIQMFGVSKLIRFDSIKLK